MNILDTVTKFIAKAVESGRYLLNIDLNDVLYADYDKNSNCESVRIVLKNGVEINIGLCENDEVRVFVDSVHRTFCGDCVC